MKHLKMGRFLLETQANPTISATDANPRTLGGSNSETKNIAKMDTNMVIILAALLCALICALSLHSILRWVLRCTRRDTDDEDQVNENATKGIKKRDLKAIPVEFYSLELKIKATECLICLGDFVEGEKVRVLPICYHGFHVKCIDTWLLSHCSCPTCRQSLLEHHTPVE